MTTTSSSTTGLYEMVLETADLERSVHFYEHIIGLRLANRWIPTPDDDREAVFLDIGQHAFLGLWPRESGGDRAIAGGRGGSHVHFALLVEYGQLAAMRERITSCGITIIEERDFGQGNHAIYVADPDGNILELTERRTDWAGELVAGAE